MISYKDTPCSSGKTGITIIEVDTLTLVLMLVSAALEAIVGAGLVSKLSERKIRLTMGFALLITAIFMMARNLE